MKSKLSAIFWLLLSGLTAQTGMQQPNLAASIVAGDGFQQCTSKTFYTGKSSNSVFSSIVLKVNGRSEAMVITEFLCILEGHMKDDGWNFQPAQRPIEKVQNPFDTVLFGNKGKDHITILIAIFPATNGLMNAVCVQTIYQD